MSQWANLGFKPRLPSPGVNALDHDAAHHPPLPLAHVPQPGPYPTLQDMWRLISSLFKALKVPSPASGWDSATLMDINQLLALVEEVICLQNMAGPEFWEEAKQRKDNLMLPLGSLRVKGKS